MSTNCMIFLFSHVICVVIDATGKYPTGLFQGSLADLGAFDECIETVVVDSRGREQVRAHYCNLFLKPGNASDIPDFAQEALLMTHRRTISVAANQADERAPGMLLGICVPTECKEDDIEKLITTFSGGGINADARNCVTNQYPPPDTRQIGIIAALGVLILTILMSTVIDLLLTRKHGEGAHRGTPAKIMTAFSVRANTRMLLAQADKESDAYTFRFLHGIRFISMAWIVLGHAYSSGTNVAGRLANVLAYSDRISYVMISGAYLSVDTFLFLGGFLLTYNMAKHGRGGSRLLLWITSVCRFYIRIITPVSFMIMCLYLLPLVISGPRAQELYERIFTDIRENWWPLMLNIRNMNDVNVEPLGHLWYLSVAFQVFAVSVTVLLFFRRQPWLAIGTFSILSTASCTYSTFKVYGTELLPFPIPQSQTFNNFLNSLNDLYIQTPIHAVSFFVGCITSILLSMYKGAKISAMSQAILWILGTIFANTAVLMTYDFNRGHQPPHWAVLCATFSQRALWSAWLAWLTIASATGRGGFICSLLSWKAFIPLSRLSYGVYLIQVPFYFVRDFTARERIFYSDFTVLTQFCGALVWCYTLSFFLFIACEAPVGRLEKLVFLRERVIEKKRTTDKETSCERDSSKPPSGHVNNGFIERTNL
ncbi:nose resistant to fluoxetine protein 6-like [Ornithodoros turicata]|uniref:nose resistant to fluoxetine protein 6-like n=1 Tax=Ornithodoros turicata TaxID=34597 RepID=UPI003139FAC8